MKKNLIILFILFFTLYWESKLSAQLEQDQQESERTYHLGFSISSLAANVLGDKLTNDLKNPSLIIGKFQNGKYGFRFGIGGKYYNDLQKEEGFADNKLQKSISYFIRVGGDYEHRFSHRIYGTFGLDFLKKYILDEDIIDSGFDKETTIKQFDGYGFGPIVGLKFNLSEHVYLYTELSNYFIFGTNEDAKLYENFPELNDINLKSRRNIIETYLPASIFINYIF